MPPQPRQCPVYFPASIHLPHDVWTLTVAVAHCHIPQGPASILLHQMDRGAITSPTHHLWTRPRPRAIPATFTARCGPGTKAGPGNPGLIHASLTRLPSAGYAPEGFEDLAHWYGGGGAGLPCDNVTFMGLYGGNDVHRRRVEGHSGGPVWGQSTAGGGTRRQAPPAPSSKTCRGILPPKYTSESGGDKLKIGVDGVGWGEGSLLPGNTLLTGT